MWYTSILSSAFNPVLRGPLISSAETTINVDRGPQSSRQSTCRSLLWMVLAGLAIRLIVVGFLYPERTDPARDHWRFGGEAGRIARSIALGEGFSNPLFGQTGPTAWLSPVFPYLLAGIFKVFGIYSKTSALLALSLD